MKHLLIFFVVIFFSSLAFSGACEDSFSVVTDPQVLKTELIDTNGEIRQKYIDQEGYIKFADTYFGGNMRKAFDTNSSVLSKDMFKRLGWQKFQGTTKEFKELKAQILDERGELRAEYIGQAEGYPRFADTYYGGEKKENGDMDKAFLNVSSVLSTDMFKRLGWQAFHGTTKEFKELKAQILDEHGELRKEYIGQAEGYLRFADTYYGGEKKENGDMQKAFINVSSVLSKDMFKRLGWQAFHGTTKDFKELKAQILNEHGELRKEYIGQEEGYLRFADTYYGGEKKENGDMDKAFRNVSSVLSKDIFKRLGWQQFQGTTKEFKELKAQILDEHGELRAEYIGQEEGYPLFADTYYGGETKENGDMQKAFQNVSSVFSKDMFKRLGWQQFKGTTKEFKELKAQILDENGELRAEYIGQAEGYPGFANTYYGGEKKENGDMKKAFINVSSVLSKDMFKRLGWQYFQGTTKEFKELKAQILDERGELRAEYIGQAEGYPGFADAYYGGEKKENGDMVKAFINVSSVLSTDMFKRLGWQKFQGTTKEFKELKAQILDKNGELRKEYIGQKEGYPRFADAYYGGEKKENGDMQKAFLNVSSVLSKDMFKRLGWQQFHGTTKEFKELKAQILDERGELREEYIGQAEGYPGFADAYYGGEKKENGDMDKAFQNVSSVLSKDMFKRLGWQQFHGTTKEFKKLKAQILDEHGELRKEYIGQAEGYPGFADTYYGGEKKENGDMAKAFINVSSVLSKDMFKRLGWQAFQGTTKEFKELKAQILDERGELRAEYTDQAEGYPGFADAYYGGDMQKAFKNVSSVLSKDMFKRLGWQAFFGTTKEFKELKTQILDERGELRAEYTGQAEGYPRFADTYYGGEKKENGDMFKAFLNVSSVLSKDMFKRLGWQQFKGTTKEFKELKTQILDERGELREEYIGQEEGYPRFADAYYGGDMQKAFKNVSSVLSKDMFQQLGWKTFQGNTNQFHTLIMYFKAHSFEDYRGGEGQRQIAELIFENNLVRTYRNVSTLREYLFINKDVFKDLRESGWSRTLR